jgi:glyoxylase-like metal-dependent hydrolase (beta-lactamase superfamily II)
MIVSTRQRPFTVIDDEEERRFMTVRRTALVLFLIMMALPAAAATTELAPGVVFVPGTFLVGHGHQPDGNSVIFDAAEGLIVVDTGRHPEHTRELIDYAAAAKKPIRAIINSHWHLDHTGGDVLMRKEVPGVRIYASNAINDARTGFLANYRKQLAQVIPQVADKPVQQKAYQTEMELVDADAAMAPDEVIARSGERTIAGRKLDLNLETWAVTAGDVWIFDPSTKILVSGDLVTLPAPLFDTACPAGWKAALDHLDEIDFKILVPGHGAPMDHKGFERYRRAFDSLVDCAASSHTKEECTEGWSHDIGDLVPDADHDLAGTLLGYYLDLLRADPASRAMFCGK